MNIWQTHLLVLFTTFISVGLKGFQHKNVIGGKTAWIAYTSYAMAFCDYWVISTISKGQWTLSLMMGTGGAAGMVLSIMLWDYLDRKSKLKAAEVKA